MLSLGFQLYSAREHGPWPEVFDTLASLGYRQVEGYGALYQAEPELGTLLDAAGLVMPTGHFGVQELQSDVDATIATVRALGCHTVFAPFLPPERRPKDVAGWRAFAKRLTRIGERMTAEGFAFGWHNHDFEFQALADGTRPIEVLFGDTDEIDWEADLAWVVRAGEDPLPWIERYGERIAAVHVKDIAPAGECADEDGWADPGEGTMDWPGLIAAVQASGRGPADIHWVAEHDNPSDLQRFAQHAHEAFAAWTTEQP